MKRILFALTFFVLTPLMAQERNIKYQPFIGSGVTTAWSNGAHSAVTTGGMAFVIQISPKVILRPVFAGGSVTPAATGESFPLAQAGALLGYKATKRTTVLGGFLETIQIPKTGPLYLPTLVVSAATRIHGRWGIYTPISFNQKGWGASLQLGYTF